MRSFLAGIFLLSLTSSALAQATGFVAEMGFQGHYRPDCWTALRVHLDSTISTAADYQIQVHQLDLDQETVVYSRTVTLGPQARQDYWVYFIPQPVGDKVHGGGLPSGQKDLLARALEVYLYDKTGKTRIARLPVSTLSQNVDRVRGNAAGPGARGEKFVLCVVERAKPRWQDYIDSVGVTEVPVFVPVYTRDLPESVLAYQGVDAILWLDGNANDLTTSGSKALEAIQQYVRMGGQLVVCHPPDQYGKIGPLADLLPIVLKDDAGEWAVETKAHNLDALIALARPRVSVPGLEEKWRGLEKSKPGGWDVAKARVRPGAQWDRFGQSIVWNGKEAGDPDAELSPYIARQGHGLGSVAWVAQDLGNPSLTGVESSGWPHVWDKVFGWRNTTYTAAEQKGLSDQQKETLSRRFQDGSPVDLGASLLKGMDHTGRATGLLALALVFFFGYWLVAGPGSYIFLAGKKRRGLSWPVFAASAVGAALLTVGVVKLVVRGGPEVKHISVVRLAPADPAPDGSARYDAVVHSRLGLYIPRDGDQRIAVTGAAAGRPSYLVPFAIHPEHLTAERFPDPARYVVDTDDYGTGGPVEVTYPYRSTVKKFSAQWSGTVAEGIAGKPSLVRGGGKIAVPGGGPAVDRVWPLGGQLVNNTGRDLEHVYFVFMVGSQDLGAYVGVWKNGAALDLDLEFNRPALSVQFSLVDPDSTNVPGRSTRALRAPLSEFARFWYRRVDRPFAAAIGFDDSEGSGRFLASYPLMSLIDRVGPHELAATVGGGSAARYDLLRRGGRELDMSAAVAAGNLVILARSAQPGPLPMPVEVEGERLTGEGTTFIQVALPLDRSSYDRPTTPTSRPATQPTTTTAPAAAAAGQDGN